MQPGVGSIVCNDPEQRVIAIVEPKNRDEPINDSKDFEKCLRGTSAGDPAEEKHDSGSKMDNVVRSVYVEDAKQHPISRSCRRDIPKNSDQQEDDTEENCG